MHRIIYYTNVLIGVLLQYFMLRCFRFAPRKIINMTRVDQLKSYLFQINGE